jgi:large subunit ribosomal protein L4
VHGPKPREYRYPMPKKARRVALRSAVLGKLQDGEVVLIDRLAMTEPKTKALASVLRGLGLTGLSTLVVSADLDKNLVLSGRNIPGVDVRVVRDMNTYDVLSHKRVLMTRAAFDAFCAPGAGKQES